VDPYTGQPGLAKTTGQSLLSLLVNFGGIIAGLTVATSLDLFLQEPWIITLYPGIISLRGVIGGLFSGHLSTGLHLGTIPTNLFGKNTKRFHVLWSSIVVLTFESSILLGLVAMLFQAISPNNLSIFDVLTIFGTLIATMGLTILVISPLTIVIAFSSFKRGLDPDIIVYPIESTIADVLVTLCYLAILNMRLSGVGWLAIAVVCIIFISIVLGVFYINRKEADFLRTLKESFFMLVLVAFIVNITGSVLSSISRFVGQRPKVYIVYPALIDTIGDLGAIVGSTATTRLALGTLDPSLKAIKNHRTQIAAAWIASIVMFTLYSGISNLYQAPSSVFEGLKFVALLLVTNILAAVFMIAISFSVAILTFQRGLDPDNFVIPVESSLADAITTISLFVMLGIVGSF
jgi:mgtE-like transporter